MTFQINQKNILIHAFSVVNATLDLQKSVGLLISPLICLVCPFVWKQNPSASQNHIYLPLSIMPIDHHHDRIVFVTVKPLGLFQNIRQKIAVKVIIK